ncbi:MAG: hypothetical protein KAG53_04815 [Endozoicomonadaceae bacterium]|nr:hypothetical protein [Endozoicomonadaceae bacterium]
MYALDVTLRAKPFNRTYTVFAYSAWVASLLGGLPAHVLLSWDYHNGSESSSDIGYIFGEPVIIKLVSGQWAAIFGNGYNSTENNSNATGEAYLAVWNQPVKRHR